MAEPTGITTNVAGIYAADLLYEQNCKCGQIQVLGSKEVYSSVESGDRVWRIDIIMTNDVNARPTTMFGSLKANNISAADCGKLVASKFAVGQTIMGDFTDVSMVLGQGVTAILYKDCLQS
tara:strand:- start:461 stop:823 length:363 start_codon:yes stop_codon:yes gene_type:complete